MQVSICIEKKSAIRIFGEMKGGFGERVILGFEETTVRGGCVFLGIVFGIAGIFGDAGIFGERGLGERLCFGGFYHDGDGQGLKDLDMLIFAFRYLLHE